MERKNRADRGRRTAENGNLTLGLTVQLLATPTGDDANNVTRNSGEYRSLARETHRLLPTPQAADGDGSRNEKTAFTTGGAKRPSGHKATLTLPTAIALSGELTATPFADGNSSPAPLPDQLTMEDA